MRYGRWLLIVSMCLGFLSAAHANMPIGNRTFNFQTPQFDRGESRTKLVVLRDGTATSATLILPKDLVTALQRAEPPRVASTGSATLVGLALVGSLVAGGLWLARMPRAKYLVGVMVPLLGFALIGSAVQAQPARLDAPRAVVETGKVRISRGSPGQIQLILPPRAAAK